MTFDSAPASMPGTAAKPMARCVPRTVFRVFVVEGQTAERTVLGQLIRRNPSLQIAGEARTAEQALAMLGAETSPPDIVCVSWLLDGGHLGRWEFVDEVRRRCPDARLMMTCPDERDEVLRIARKHGVAVLHSTRDSFHSLRRALHHAAQGQPYVSPRLKAAARRAEGLAPHLQEILSHVADGDRVGLSELTIGFHTRAIFTRLGVDERVHGLRAGLVRADG
jgi:DNA-binding NarL/FixJ family response regulator